MKREQETDQTSHAKMLLTSNILQDCDISSHPFLISYKALSILMRSNTSNISMASTSSSSLLNFSHDHERTSLESIRVIVASINHHINEFLSDAKTRESVKLKCTSNLSMQKRDFCEFAEHSILSNLYWGIESIEAAIQAKWPEVKSFRLKNSEQMLQIPALLEENGATAGILNSYLICCSYFYLSLVRNLQGDEWQVALHFLQAVLISPGLVWTQFAPMLCNSLFGSCMITERTDFDEDETGDKIMHMARSYRAWLMYFQVMSYGEKLSQWNSGHRYVDSADDESRTFTNRNRKSTGTASSSLQECNNGLLTYSYSVKVCPFDPQEYTTHNMPEECKVSDATGFQGHTEPLTDFDQVHSEEVKRSSSIRYFQDMLTESPLDAPISKQSCYSGLADEDDFEVHGNDSEMTNRAVVNADDPQQEIFQNQVEPCSILDPDYEVYLLQASGDPTCEEANEGYITNFVSGRSYGSFSALDLSIMELRDMESYTLLKSQVEDITRRRLHQHDLQNVTSKGLKNYRLTQMDQNPYLQKNPNKVHWQPGTGSDLELMGILEKAISKLCFSEGLRRCDEDYTVEVVQMYEMLNTKRGVKYTLLKDLILDQLLNAISTSKDIGVIRASVSILSTLVLGNKAVIEEINKNGLHLSDLASALKRNVHEAAILIYLINPPPAEIKTLELLPTLVEVVCTSNSYKDGLISLLPTPPVASLMIIEVLVTAFDYATNSMHLAAINSPHVLSKLLDVPRSNNLEDFTSLATILVRCMRFDGQCRKYISKSTQISPFASLLRSNQEQARLIALEFFHELLCIPRLPATKLLQQMQEEGGIDNMNMLLLIIQQSQPEYKLLAANLLLQLEIFEDSPCKSSYREQAMEALFKSLACEENSSTKQLTAFLLSNLGGTYAWTGQPYTVAWLLKKTGLTTQLHRNIMRNFNWSDQSLQDLSTDTWCSKMARNVTKIGKPVFHALEKGLKSRIKKVSQDCLTAVAWIGCEIASTPDNLRYTACEIILTAVEQFLHPGLELEERLLACLCIYNYASGKGMQKLLHFSEGVRESLRRLSDITWMAEELLRVAYYFLPNKWRISCVHTQILEARQNYSGAVTALSYYKGQLCSGNADGSIKVWDIKGQTATLVLDMKEHKKAVACFSLFEPGDCLLSGSADKTIRIWQMVRRKLECIEIIEMKEPIQCLDTSGPLIFAVTQSHEMKVIDSSRTTRDICKTKRVKCVRVIHGKAYVGCMDSSMQELAIANKKERQIKAPSKIWRIQSKPINSISVYKDWLYTASAVVEGSNIKEWRRQSKPQISILPEKGTNVLAMEVVEDFIYVNCSPSTSVLQIWLRETQQKVGRLSAGGKITSLLTGNDIIFCGTEKGLIKGWIPL